MLMHTNSLSVNRFKAQLSKFSGIISEPYSKTNNAFLREANPGIHQHIKIFGLSIRLLNSWTQNYLGVATGSNSGVFPDAVIATGYYF